MIIFASLFLPKIALSQPECQFNDARAEVTTPIELGICDLTFPVPVIVIHDYPVAHDFTIVIYYNPNFVTLASSGALTNVTTSNGTNSNLIVTGTFTVPFDENFSAATLELAFNRVRTDYYGGMRIVVYDANCGTDPVAILNNIQVQSDPPMVNLSPFTSNLSTLIALGILDDCPAPGCISAPNVLVDDLDVNTNYAFDRTGAVTGSIVLLPGATITVLSGRTLTINNYDIFACGGELGQGIIVESGATLVLNGCNISDCRFGIDVQAGATISVKNCNFANNYVGARFNMTAAPFRAVINSFENNNFYGDSPLKAPFSGMPEQVEERGYCGILVSRYMDFNIWGGNDFYALANGIIVTNTTGNLGNMTFDDIQSTGAKRYEREGIGIHVAGYGTNSYMNLNDAGTTMTFNDCKTGIQGFYNGGDVENVTMTNVDIGIDWALSQKHQLTFLGNTITAKKHGIRSSFNEPTDAQSIIYENTIVVTGSGAGTSPATGILVNEGGLGQKPENGWNIDVNQVTMQNGGRGIQYRNGSIGFVRRNTVTNLSQANNYDGIWIEGVGLSNISGNSVTQNTTAGLGDSRAIRSSGGWANVVELNCVDNTNAGLQFYDMADFSNNVSGNSMNNHITGLQLGEPGIGNVFIGDQYHTGNIWDLGSIPGSGFGGVHWGGPFIVGASEFSVDEAENAAFNPPVDPGNGWFIDQATSEPTPGAINCSFPPTTSTPRGGEDANPTNLDLIIAADTLPTNIFQNETRWKGAYRLCRKMLRNPDLALESTLMTTFKAANATLSTGKLAFIAEERGKLFDLTTNEQAISDTLNANTKAQMETLRLLDSLRQSGAAVNATLYATVLQERADAQALLEQFTLGLDTTRQQKIQNLLSVNALVSTTMRPDSNHKTVNIIFLNMLAADSISASNLAVLAGIAGQCPLEGGDAVYEARAIVSYLIGEEYEDRVLCSEVGQRDQQNQAARLNKENAITLYPNPATNIVYWSGTGSELVTIKLYNQLGQLQFTQKTIEGFTQTGKLLAGFYTVQIHSQGGELLTTQRLIIQ